MECGSALTRVAWPVAVLSIRLIAPSSRLGAGRLGIVAMLMISALRARIFIASASSIKREISSRLHHRHVVLCTRVALAMGFLVLWLGLEPGRKLLLPLGLLLGYPVFMAESIKDTPKKRGPGRPPTGGRREGVMVRLEPAQFETLDDWIKKHAPDLSRPEAIRRLVELGLKVKASK